MLFFGILTNNWLVYKKNWLTTDIYICYLIRHLDKIRVDIDRLYLNKSNNKSSTNTWQYLDSIST